MRNFSIWSFLLLLGLSAGAQAQTTYYLCANPGNNFTALSLSTSPALTGCANVANGTWNSVSPRNTLIIPSPRDLALGSGNGTATFNANVIVQSGGTISWGGNIVLVVASGSTMTVDAGGSVGQGGTADMTVEGALVMNGALAVDDLTINGSMTGTGTISSVDVMTGTGTLAGYDPATVDATAPYSTPPIVITDIQSTWNGAAWTLGSPENSAARARISGNYTFSTDAAFATPIFTAGILTIDAGFTATFDDDVDLSQLTSGVVNGNMVLVNDANVAAGFTVNAASTGNITLRRNFTTTRRWTRMGFPVGSAGGRTVADIGRIGWVGSASNIRYWNASTSTWTVAPTTLPLAGQALIVFPPSAANNGVEVTTTAVNFHNTGHTFTLGYHSGYGGAGTDGWNQLTNPVPDFLSSQAVVTAMQASGLFASNTVYIWDGAAYRTWSFSAPPANDADAEFMGVHEAFFVRALSTSDGQAFSVAGTARATSTPGGGTYLGASNKQGSLQDRAAKAAGGVHAPDATYISVRVESSNGKHARTYVGQNDAATEGFNVGADATYSSPDAHMPALYSVNADGLGMRVSKVPSFTHRVVPLGFHSTTSDTYTISLDALSLPRGGSVHLYDRHTDIQVRLDKHDYSFEHDGTAPTERFELRFKGRFW